jgi:large subunit ribosomal protein L15
MPLYRRVPKLKHFPLVNPKHFTVLNVSALKDLKDGATVNLDSLVKDGIVQASAFTTSARTKIEAAGGTCETLD